MIQVNGRAQLVWSLGLRKHILGRLGGILFTSRELSRLHPCPPQEVSALEILSVLLLDFISSSKPELRVSIFNITNHPTSTFGEPRSECKQRYACILRKYAQETHSGTEHRERCRIMPSEKSSQSSSPVGLHSLDLPQRAQLTICLGRSIQDRQAVFVCQYWYRVHRRVRPNPSRRHFSC